MQPDVIIIGSGMGGATLAAKLAPSGCRILILERGEFLRPSSRDRDATAIFRDGVFRPDEQWLDGTDTPFNPGNYYNVGGNSKFYGAALIRYREVDFGVIDHRGGATAGWPLSYAELEPDYQAAEHLYRVAGDPRPDPTEPHRSGEYRHAVIPHEPDIARLAQRFLDIGLHPSPIPLGVDLERWLEAGETPWDAYPATCAGKMDAETCGLEAALSHPNVELRTGSRVLALITGADSRIESVVVEHEGSTETIPASVIVVAAGAVQTAALLLASANDNWPRGLANSSDQLGRNFMNHNSSAVLALHPFRRNRCVYQKTLMMNDFYCGTDGSPPLGNIQMLGKITGPVLAANSGLPIRLANWVAARSFDFYAMSEDLPDPQSRVTLKDGQVRLDWKRSNQQTHDLLVATLKRVLRKAGFPVVASRAFDHRTPSHQCGTARMGNSPQTSVVDTFCRSHDHRNLFVVDASVLPTSAAVNPALTIAALALRAGRHMLETELAA